MEKLEKMIVDLAKVCREGGLNFVVAIEEGGKIHGQSSVRGKSKLRDLTNCLKKTRK